MLLAETMPKGIILYLLEFSKEHRSLLNCCYNGAYIGVVQGTTLKKTTVMAVNKFHENILSYERRVQNLNNKLLSTQPEEAETHIKLTCNVYTAYYGLIATFAKVRSL